MSSQTQAIPQPKERQRDNDGRLIHLVIDGPLPLPAQSGNAWLVAIDGSEHAQHAVTQAMQLVSQTQDGRLHLLNVQHWLSKEAAEVELPRRGWEASAMARTTLTAAGIPWCLHVSMGDSAERIVEVAKQSGCRGIVIGSRGLGAAKNLLIGSVAYKVIHLSPISVLVAR